MKKCASCTKDLPDAALHCVFCGAKQPPAPAVQQGPVRTAFGYSANDFSPQSRPVQQPAPTYKTPPPRVGPAPQTGVPIAPPPRPVPATAPSNASPSFSSSSNPSAPAQSGMAYAPTAPPPPPTQPQGQGGYVPTSSAGAATMFVPGPGQPPQPMTLQSPPTYGRSNPPGPSASALPPTLVPPPTMQPTPMQAAPMQPAMPMMYIPAQPPPYLASQTASRATRPIEPWRDNLRLMMFMWGVALLVAFATPLRTSPDLLFNWKLILDGESTTRLPLLVLAGVGLLSVIVAAIPMPSAPRGLLAALLGLAGVFVPILLVAVPPWRPLISLIGMLLLVPSLILRSEYRSAALPRILVTLGAAGVLAPFVVPEGNAILLVNIFKGVIEQAGSAKVEPALALGLIVIVVMSLLAWLPAPVTGGAKLWAWLLILWALIVHVTHLVLAGNLGDVITKSPNQALVSWIAGGAGASTGIAIGSAYLVLVGYGLASVVGKQLE